MSYGGRWEQGVALSERAMALNPNHPGWYRFGIAFDQLRRGEYQAALETGRRINLPNYFADAYVRAVAHAYLGNTHEAAEAAQEFFQLWPRAEFETFQHQHLDRWFYASPELIEMTIKGLEMAAAGLD